MSEPNMTVFEDTESETPNVSLDAVSSASQEIGTPTPTYREGQEEIHPEREGNSSDEVDVRRLFNDPTTNFIRWLYRQQGVASTVVDKPIEDAFKHGYGLEHSDQETDSIEQWATETYVPKHKSARIKARRDGLALIFWMVKDDNSVEEEIANPTSVESLKVLKLEDLEQGLGNPRHTSRTASGYASASTVAEHVKYDEESLVVTKSGLVVVDDITSPDHEDFVGCLYEDNPNISDEPTFIHRDRLQLFTERGEVDGDVENLEYGHVEGDSVLTQILHPLTGVVKAEWALGQSLLRHTAPLHTIEIGSDVQPEDSWEDHIEKMNGQMDNITNKSNMVLPPDHTMDTHGADGNLDPEQFLDGLYNSICAGAEITRSVLLGTQSGTVSGSSTDIKNYYNQVERERDGQLHDDTMEALSMLVQYDDSYSIDVDGINQRWGSLFKIDDIDRTDGMVKVISALSNGVGKYLLTPEEARDIAEQEWAKIDVDVDLDDLTEAKMDQLDRVNTQKGKQYPEGESAEEEVEETERSGNNGGGRSSQGNEPNTTDPNDPT